MTLRELREVLLRCEEELASARAEVLAGGGSDREDVAAQLERIEGKIADARVLAGMLDRRSAG